VRIFTRYGTVVINDHSVTRCSDMTRHLQAHFSNAYHGNLHI
jgi:hypothetical protein